MRSNRLVTDHNNSFDVIFVNIKPNNNSLTQILFQHKLILTFYYILAESQPIIAPTSLAIKQDCFQKLLYKLNFTHIELQHKFVTHFQLCIISVVEFWK